MRKSLAATMLAALVVMPACTAGGTKNADKGGSSASEALRVAYQTDVNTFDPDNNFEVQGLSSILAVYQGLVTYKPGTTQVEGLLAKSWDVSKDRKVYTFHLQSGVKFHDGATMTSADVKRSFERRMNKKFVLSYFLANIAAMRATDPSTFVLTLKVPQPSLLDNLASAWGPKVVGPDALIKHAGSDNSATYLNENGDGTGPYLLSAVNRGSQYTLKRFDSYWRQRPHFAEVDIKIISDIGQQVLELRSGDLDAVLHGYPFPQLGNLPSGVHVASYGDLGLEIAYVNVSHLDAAQRRAVQAAVAPSTWVNDAFGKWAKPAQSLFPAAMLTPPTPWAWPESGGSPSAKKTIQIVYASEEANIQQRVADLMIAALQKSGFKATARPVAANEIQNYGKDPAKAPADLVLAQNNPDSAFPGTQTDLFFATGAPLNIFGYSNKRADALFSKASGMTDKQQRNATYLKGAKLVFDDAAFLPLADVQDIIVARDSLKNLPVTPAVPWNFDFGTAS